MNRFYQPRKEFREYKEIENVLREHLHVKIMHEGNARDRPMNKYNEKEWKIASQLSSLCKQQQGKTGLEG